MSAQIECPGCRAKLAYSSALLGRTVRCHLCEREFPIAALADADAVVAPSSTLNPPPLPARNASGSRLEDAEELPDNESDASPEFDAGRQHSGVGSVFGFVALLVAGFLIVSAGIGYLAWPGSSRQTAPAIPSAAPPAETPVEVEHPKSLQELMGKGAGQPEANPPGIPPPQAPKSGPRFK
jgi:hypothetical protein